MSNAIPVSETPVISAADHSLILCLHTVAHLNGHPLSVRALLAGLPQDKITHTFMRAAQRVGLSPLPMLQPLSIIREAKLPCILILKDGRACVILSVKDDDVQAIFPDIDPFKEETVSFEALSALYTNQLYILKVSEQDVNEETGEKTSAKSHWLWGMLYHFRNVYGHVAIASVVTNLLTLLVPLFSMNVYDRVVSHQAVATLWVLSLGVFISLIFDFVLRLIKAHFVDVTGKNIDIVLSSQLVERILGIKLASYPLSSGTLISHVREMEGLREFFSSAMILSLIDMPFAFLFLLVIWYIGGYLALITLIFVALIIFSSLVFSRIVSHYLKKATAESNRKNSFLVELVLGLETLKAFCAQGKMQQVWENMSENHSSQAKYGNFFSSLAGNLTSFFQNANYVVIIIAGVYLIFDNHLTTGGLIACSILTSRVTTPFAQAVGLIMRLNYMKISYETIDKVMALPAETSCDRTYISLPTIQGKIEFKGVDFTYPGQQKKVLKNLTFSIQPGEKVAVMGRIGSGKTTLEKLILSFYEPCEGSVLIDGFDNRQIEADDLRSSIGYVPQEIQLFSGTLRDNILLRPDRVSPEELLQALEISGVVDFIKDHPLGLDMQIGEGGRYLSGGQRQSVAIARALLGNPSILILDEPTSMMDQTSEARLLHQLKNTIQNKTVLVVTHTASVLSLVDRIVVMDQGTIVYDGPRQDFLTRVRGGAEHKPSSITEKREHP